MELKNNLDYMEIPNNKGVINANDCEKSGVVVDDSPILSENKSVIPDKDEFSVIFCGGLIFEVSMEDATHVRSMATDDEKITYLLNKGYSGIGTKIHGYYRN